MSFCPACGAAYREGTVECPACHVPLTSSPPEASSPGDVRWTSVYVGSGVQLRSVAEALRAVGFEVVQLPGENPEAAPVSSTGRPDGVRYRVAIPEVEFEARQAEVEAIVGAAQPTTEIPDAVLEAEEDYDVRGCPRCLLFFHENYAHCPGCQTELVPAVECFEEGQAEPDRVIVGHGTQDQVKALEQRLRAVGLDAQTFEVEDWPVDVVDLSWAELTDRTAEAEVALGLRPPTT